MSARHGRRLRGLVGTALGAVMLAAATACLNNDITGSRILTLSITADPNPATVGQDVDFTYVATGTGLSQVILDYGDGTADTVTFSGPVEASGRLTHAFQSAASFDVFGSVRGFSGTATQTVTVTVN